MDEISKAISHVEKQNHMKIIYAVEGGSKSFGLESSNSDFDVRVLYVNEITWYLDLNEKLEDTIVYKEGDVDMNCIEIRKALRLIRNHNIMILEWLENPFIYHSTPIIQNLRESVSKMFSKPDVIINYALIANTNWTDYIKPNVEVNQKKYLYIFRHLLSAIYLLRDDKYDKMPPIYVLSMFDFILV